MHPNTTIVVILVAILLFMAIMVYFLRIWWRHKLSTSAHNDHFERRRARQPEVAVQKIELADRGGKRHWVECREAQGKQSSEKRAGRAGPPAPGSGHGGLPIGGGGGGDGKPVSQNEWEPQRPVSRLPSKPASQRGWSLQLPAAPRPPSKPASYRNDMPAHPTPARLPSKPSSRDEWRNQQPQPAPQTPIKPPSNRRGMPATPASAAKVPSRIALQDEWDVPQRVPEHIGKPASFQEWKNLPPSSPAEPVASKQGSKRSYRPRSAPRGPSQAGSRGWEPQDGMLQQQGPVDPNALTAALQQTAGEAQEPDDGW